MNKVELTGRVAREVKFETTTSQKIIRNAIAVKRPFKDVDGKYKADFIEFSLFDIKAEHFSEYVKKGDIIELTGRLIVKDRKKEGVKFKTNEFLVETIGFLSRRSEGDKSE
jgi:single-strand DNA-binding protein